MNPLGGLRASLSRYRRRKLSLDGRAAGIEYSSYRHSHGRAVQTGHALQRTVDSDYLGLRQPETYDPQAAFYHADALAYDHPEPFRDSATAGTPAIPGAAPLEYEVARLCSLDPTINRDFARWLLPEFVNNSPRQPAPDAIPFDHNVRFEGPIGPTINDPGSDRTSIAEIWDVVTRCPTYEASLMTRAKMFPFLPSFVSLTSP